MEDEEFNQWICDVPDVASALRDLRTTQQLTLEEVAKLAGVSKPYVLRLEQNERFPERDTLIALLLAAFSLPVIQANRILLLAEFAPFHHKKRARMLQ